MSLSRECSFNGTHNGTFLNQRVYDERKRLSACLKRKLIFDYSPGICNLHRLVRIRQDEPTCIRLNGRVESRQIPCAWMDSTRLPSSLVTGGYTKDSVVGIGLETA
jgi:hypothetical protein